MKKLTATVRALRARRDDGASAVEYGLLVALIAVIIAGAVAALGVSLNNKFSNVNCTVSSGTSCSTPGTGS